MPGKDHHSDEQTVRVLKLLLKGLDAPRKPAELLLVAGRTSLG